MENLSRFIFVYVCVYAAYSAPSSFEKRTHNHGPEWMDGCWDHGPGHFVNPLCDLLTTPTTTTTIPITTTTTPAPTTTPRSCGYEVFNNSNIRDTDYVSTVQGAESGAVHVTQNLVNCQGLCERSLLQNSFECWAFTYNYQNSSIGCYLYYYPQPLHHVSGGVVQNGTTLYLKRCSDDPFGNSTYSTVSPNSTSTTQQQHTSSPFNATSSQPIMHSSRSATSIGTTVSVHSGSTSAVVVSRSSSTTPVPIVDTNSFRVQGVTQQVPDTCYFLGRTFSLGDTWKDTCRYDCQCTNTTTNIATCIDTCPVYTNVTSNCQVVKRPGSCCGILDCSGVGPTVSERSCTFDVYNNSAISSTDFGPALPMRDDTNITLNKPVFLAMDRLRCEMICIQSWVHVRLECRAYTFSSNNTCHMYHYFRPLNYVTPPQNSTGTTLYLKWCSDDPVKAPTVTTATP